MVLSFVLKKYAGQVVLFVSSGEDFVNFIQSKIKAYFFYVIFFSYILLGNKLCGVDL
jgi:hypothetical protein